MSTLVKYPKTFHLPWSPHNKRDDRKWDKYLLEGKNVVVTEKMDGENTTLYRDEIHARSLTSSSHPSRHWVRGFHASIRHQIPEGWRICGENMYAVHSMEYKDLESYFLVFGIWIDDFCVNWSDTEKICADLGLTTVPFLASGNVAEANLHNWASKPYWTKREGYVVRLADQFHKDEWEVSCAKYVRPSHVRSNSHWMYQELKVNGLREDTSHNKS